MGRCVVPYRDKLPEDHVLSRLFGYELHYPEYTLAGQSLAWGIWMWNPYIDWDKSAYALLVAVIPWQVWSIMLVGCGYSLWRALNRRKPRLQSYALAGLFLTWLGIAATLGFQNMAWTMYTSMAILSLLGWLRSRGARNN